MKNLQLVVLTASILLIGSSNAMALSTERSNSIYNDSTSQFADPDEQTPPMLAGPNDNAGRGFQSSPGNSVQSPTLPQMMGADRGQQSFDHAYSHLTNQNQ